MGILNKGLAKKHAKLKVIPLGSVADALSVETGFPLIDYNTGTVCETKDGEEFLNIGLPMGKIHMFFGNSQGGKTTLAMQIAHAMAFPYNGDVVILDYERSSSNLGMRYRQINQCSKEDYENTVALYKHADMSTEFFKKVIFDIVEMKKELKKSDMLEWMDTSGETIYIYPPTVILVDSIPSVKPEEVLKDASLDNNMIASKMAAANNNILLTIVNLLETYNITVFGINHLSKKIIINQYNKPKPIYPGMPEDENLPGGKGWHYMPSYVFRVNAGAELKADKDFVEGRETEIRLIKTRSGFNNKRLPFILSGKIGFSKAHTIVNWAKKEKLLTGSGQKYSFEGTNIEFSMKKFEGIYNSNDEFREAFDSMVIEHLEAQVVERFADIENSDIDPNEFSEDEEFDVE